MNKNLRTNVCKMLMMRNYVVENQNDFINSDIPEFLTHRIGNEDDKIFVFFPQITTKVGVVTIRQYIKEMQDNFVTKAIIIVKDTITAFAKQEFSEYKNIDIECFKDTEFLIDKLSHVLVPKHELISEDDKRELLKLYKIKEVQIPKILSADPMAKYFGAKKGQVFKITRITESCGDYIYYRIVV